MDVSSLEVSWVQVEYFHVSGRPNLCRVRTLPADEDPQRESNELGYPCKWFGPYPAESNAWDDVDNIVTIDQNGYLQWKTGTR